jgi:hypothetical protein
MAANISIATYFVLFGPTGLILVVTLLSWLSSIRRKRR